MAASDRADDGHAGSHADGHEGGHEDSHEDGGEAQREECFALLARLLGLLGGQAVLPRSLPAPGKLLRSLVKQEVNGSFGRYEN